MYKWRNVEPAASRAKHFMVVHRVWRRRHTQALPQRVRVSLVRAVIDGNPAAMNSKSTTISALGAYRMWYEEQWDARPAKTESYFYSRSGTNGKSMVVA